MRACSIRQLSSLRRSSRSALWRSAPRRTLCIDAEHVVDTSALANEPNPEQTVSILDRFIVGQQDAKRAVAIALRSRVRRQCLSPVLQREVQPMHILMTGPTGSGKTEIARRLASMAGAPFVKVEATRYTEVGVVGTDTVNMVKDLVAAAVQLERERVREQARSRAIADVEAQLLQLLQDGDAPPENTLQRLRAGELDEHCVDLPIRAPRPTAPLADLDADEGMRQFNLVMHELRSSISEPRTRTLPVKQARAHLLEAALADALESDDVVNAALRNAEQGGIIFIDEIDKVAHASGRADGVHARKGEAVQKELLSVLEGTVVNTRFGAVNTQHMLFIAAGAFHLCKPSDLLPELQGRLPIRVSLSPLRADDFRRILTATEFSLLKQTKALMAAEGVDLQFTDCGVTAIAEAAEEMNRIVDNIGARRLRTVLARLTEDISFKAHRLSGTTQVVDGAFVRDRLRDVVKQPELRRYIL